MQKLFDYFITRFPHDVQDRLSSAIQHQTDLNPNDRLHKGVCRVLKETLDDISELKEIAEMDVELKSKSKLTKKKRQKQKEQIKSQITNKLTSQKEIAFQLASLSCYLIPPMKASSDYLNLLEKIEHPYIDLFRAYFNDNPSNYKTTREIVDNLSNVLPKISKYNDEIEAHLLAVKSAVYGQVGDVVVLKEIYRQVHATLPETENIVVIRGLQDAATNIIWWLLHSGVEANIFEMLDFLEPNIIEHKLYMSYTDFLNLKGAVLSYFGDNVTAIELFEQLKDEHEKYHDNYRKSIAIGNLSESYFTEGRIIKAKEMMEEAIKLYKESTGKWPYLYLTELGNMYYFIGDKRAEESLLHAYEIQKEEQSMFKAFILFELIHFYLKTEQLEKARSYLGEMKNLAKDLQTLSVNAQVDYLLGYFEMINYNFSNAEKYLTTALDLAQQANDFDMILTCNIQLAALLLQKYRISENQDILNTVMNHIDLVVQLAIENNHNQILTIGLVIRALISASRNEFDAAFKDLKEVKMITSKIDYEKWNDELQLFEDKIIQAQNEQNFVLDRESIFSYILPQFKSMLSFKLAERKPKISEVLGLLVISKSGVPIYTNISDRLKADKMILSGLLAAVNNFSEGMIEGVDKGRLKEVLYEDFWLIVQPIENGLVAVIASDPTAEIRMWAINLANRIVKVPVVISELSNKLEKDIEDILLKMNIKHS